MSFARRTRPRTMAVSDSDSERGKGTILLNFASAYPGSSAGAGLLLLRFLLGFSGLQEAWQLRTGINPAVATELELFFSIIALALLVGWQTRIAAVLFFIAVAVNALWVRQDSGLESVHRSITLLLPAGTALALALLGPGSFSMDARRFGRHEIVIEPVDRNQ